jgi:hypothetical protein
MEKERKISVPFDEVMIDNFKEDPEWMMRFLRFAITEFEKDGDQKLLKSALNLAIEAISSN